MPTDIDLKLIRTDGGTQMRSELRKEVYLEYRDQWLSGVVFDPVDLYHDGSAYWLADGFHRFYGAREAKLETIPANVHQGTQRDAILHATGANTDHGLRRSNADKRKAVETLLNDEEWCKWSDNKIAEQAAVSQQFVSNVRRELTTVVSSPAARTADEPRVGRDGKKRKPRTSSAPKATAAPAAPTNGKPPQTRARKPSAAEIFKPLLDAIGKAARECDAVAKKTGGQGAHHKSTLGHLSKALEAARAWKGDQ